MTPAAKILEESVNTRPLLECWPVAHVNSQALESVAGAFQSRSSCALGQAWQAEPCPAFAPASVRVAYSEQELLVFAELTDLDIHTEASGPNQRLWELGDAFEMFLSQEDDESYLEFQVAPNIQRLQLRYENRAALDWTRQHGISESVLLPSDSFFSKVWITENRWHVFARIPAALVNRRTTRFAGSCWRYSFSRYNYTRGKGTPVISSSSPHAQMDFHRKQEWGHLHFRVP